MSQNLHSQVQNAQNRKIDGVRTHRSTHTPKKWREKERHRRGQRMGIGLTLLPFQAWYTNGPSPPTPAPAFAPFIAAALWTKNRRRDHAADHDIAGSKLPPLLLPLGRSPSLRSAPSTAPRRWYRKPRHEREKRKRDQIKWRGISSWGRVVISGFLCFLFLQKAPPDFRVLFSHLYIIAL